MNEPIVEAWTINNRLNLYLLEAIPVELQSTPLSKGKSVSENFRHIHNVRLMWIKVAAPDLMDTQTKMEKDEPHDLVQRLNESSVAIEEIFRRAGTPDGKVKGFKPHAAGFLGYLVAHESYHRTCVELALRQAGHALSDKVAYGIWEWGSR